MTEPDLKPCPFCGGSVSIGISDEGTTGAIECAKGSSCIGSGLLIGFMKADQETAIAAWNTRAVDPAAIREAMADRIEQLVKERDEAERNETLCSNMAVNYLERAEHAEAKLAKAVEGLRMLVKLDDDYSPFGGELLRDRVVRTWEEARAVLAELEKTE